MWRQFGNETDKLIETNICFGIRIQSNSQLHFFQLHLEAQTMTTTTPVPQRIQHLHVSVAEPIARGYSF